MRVPESKETEKKAENLFENNGQNFLNLRRKMDIQIQETGRIPTKINFKCT